MPNPLVIPAGYAQATFSLFLAGRAKPFSFGCGFHLGADEASLANELGNWFNKTTPHGFCNNLSDNYITNHVEVRGHSAIAIKPGGVLGSDAGADVSPGLALKIKKVTGLAGKAHKGFMFWPGFVADASVDNFGSISGATLSALLPYVTEMVTAAAVDGSTPVILHHSNSSDTTPTPITAFLLLPTIRSQRRRQTPR